MQYCITHTQCSILHCVFNTVQYALGKAYRIHRPFRLEYSTARPRLDVVTLRREVVYLSAFGSIDEDIAVCSRVYGLAAHLQQEVPICEGVHGAVDVGPVEAHEERPGALLPHLELLPEQNKGQVNGQVKGQVNGHVKGQVSG